MLTMESGEWSIQCPVMDRRFLNRSAAVQCYWMGIEEFSNKGQTVSASRAKLSIFQFK